MSSIIANLKSIKDKIASLTNSKKPGTSNEDEEPISVVRKKRVALKLNAFFENLNKVILLNIGGEAIIPSNVEIYFNFKYKLSIINKIKAHDLSKKEPLFIDICLDVWETLAEIIRINPTVEEQSKSQEIINLYTKADMPVVQAEAKILFESDWQKLSEMVKIHYYPCNRKLCKLAEISSISYQYQEDIWDKNTKIKCYLCNKYNDGKFWKIKYSSSKRSDGYVINGYFATCLVCDPTGIKKY